jgi:hypothetical protein
MRDSGWFGNGDGSDGEYNLGSFGQLVPLILLALPVLSVLESIAGKPIALFHLLNAIVADI